MKNRCENFGFEVEKGKTFKASEGTSGESVTRPTNTLTHSVSAGGYAEVLSVYTDKDGNQAVIPPGWVVSGVDTENTIWGKGVSLVIYRIPKEKVCDIDWADSKKVVGLKEEYDQFVWVPVSLLEANGTLDGEHFSEKFGRRNYMSEVFSDNEFHEELTGKLSLQVESVKKYGGFYISRYDLSKSSARKPQSVKGVMPWVDINFVDAKKIAFTIEYNEAVKSHLTFGAEYDSVLEWFIKTGAKTFAEIAKDSTKWGNYWNTKNSPRKVVKTGSREEWCANNIYDFAGNVDEWTQKQKKSPYRVIRGGNCRNHGYYYPFAYRFCNNPGNDYNYAGFRAALYIK